MSRFANTVELDQIRAQGAHDIAVIRASDNPSVQELTALKQDFAKDIIEAKNPTIIFSAHGMDAYSGDDLVSLSEIKKLTHDKDYYSYADEIVSKVNGYFERGIEFTNNVEYSNSLDWMPALQASKLTGDEFADMLESRFKAGNTTDVFVEIESCYGTNFALELLKDLKAFKEKNPDFRYPTVVTTAGYGQSSWLGEERTNTTQTLALLLQGSGTVGDVIKFQTDPKNRKESVNRRGKENNAYLLSTSAVFLPSKDGSKIVQIL